MSPTHVQSELLWYWTLGSGVLLVAIGAFVALLPVVVLFDTHLTSFAPETVKDICMATSEVLCPGGSLPAILSIYKLRQQA